MSRDFARTTQYVIGVDLAADGHRLPLIPKYARWATLQDTHGTGAMLAANRVFVIDADNIGTCEPLYFPLPDNLRMFINEIAKNGGRIWLMEQQDGECLGPNISGTSDPIIAILYIDARDKPKSKGKTKLPGFRLLDLD